MKLEVILVFLLHVASKAHAFVSVSPLSQQSHSQLRTSSRLEVDVADRILAESYANKAHLASQNKLNIRGLIELFETKFNLGDAIFKSKADLWDCAYNLDGTEGCSRRFIRLRGYYDMYASSNIQQGKEVKSVGKIVEELLARFAEVNAKAKYRGLPYLLIPRAKLTFEQVL